MGKTGSIQVRFTDGQEHVMVIHGIRQLDVYAVIDELDIKSFHELTNPEDNLQAFRAMVRIVATALTFPNQKEVWNATRVQQTFADPNEILRVFNKCIELSDLPKGPGATGITPSKSVKKSGAYG
jgi:hypothetical protein